MSGYGKGPYGVGVYAGNSARISSGRPGSYVSVPRIWKSDIFGTKLDLLSPARGTRATAQFNDDYETKRRATAEVIHPDAIKDLEDFLTIEMDFTDDQGYSETIALGNYVAMGREISMGNTLREGVIHGRDLTWLLQRSTIEPMYVVSAGSDPGAAARTIAIQRGIPSFLVNIPDAGVLTTEDIPSLPGENWLTYMTAVLAAGAMYQPWVAADHRLTSRKVRDIGSADPDMYYHTASGAKIVPPVREPLTDLTDVWNRVTVRKQIPGDQMISWTATIEDMSHPLHPVNLGRRMGAGETPIILAPRPFEEHTIETETEARALAEARLGEGASRYQKLLIETYPDPTTLDAHQIFDLDLIYPVDGVSYYTGRWWQRTWEVRLQDARATVRREVFRTVPWR